MEYDSSHGDVWEQHPLNNTLFPLPEQAYKPMSMEKKIIPTFKVRGNFQSWPKRWISTPKPNVQLLIKHGQPELKHLNKIEVPNIDNITANISSIPTSYLFDYPKEKLWPLRDLWYSKLCPEAKEFFETRPFLKTRYFEINSFEMDAMMACLVHLVSSTLTENNIPHALFAGSLIGQTAHHGILPWDDDIDMIVEISKLDQLVEVLKIFCNKDSGFDYIFYMDSFVKVFYVGGGTFVNSDFPWPVLDIFMTGVENGNLVEIDNHDVTVKNKVPLNMAFPMKWGYFNGRFIPILRKSIEHINSRYESGICSTGSWNHIEQDKRLATLWDCSQLKRHIPFVYRNFKGKERLALQLSEETFYIFHEIEYDRNNKRIFMTKYL